jgi:hypothetical protein
MRMAMEDVMNARVEPPTIEIAQLPPLDLNSTDALTPAEVESSHIPASLSNVRSERTVRKFREPREYQARTVKMTPRRPEGNQHKQPRELFAPVIIYTGSKGPDGGQNTPRRTPGRPLFPERTTMAFAGRPVTSPSSRVREGIRPKKRSFVARAFPAIFRKPWNLMKSIASKLH